jgi:hypothetical protein
MAAWPLRRAGAGARVRAGRRAPRPILGLVVLVLLGSLVAGCGTVSTATPTAPPSLVTRIETPDGSAGVARINNALQLLLFADGGWHPVTHVPDQPGQTTIHLYTYGGDSGRTTNSFVFGDAPPGAAMFRVSLEGAQERVTSGVFLVALRLKDLTPSELHWTFLKADGTTLSSGSGIQG